MWKLKDFAEGATKAENARKIKALLEGLKPKIQQIKHLEFGIDVSNKDGSYDIVLYTEFENSQDHEVYQNHPEHQNATDFVRKVRLERILVDCEI
jgi:hypothetical protein